MDYIHITQNACGFLDSSEFENKGLCTSGLKTCSAIVALGDKKMILIHVEGDDGTISSKNVIEQIKKVETPKEIMIAIKGGKNGKEKTNAENNREKYFQIIQKDEKLQSVIIRKCSFKKGAGGFAVNDDKIIPEDMSLLVKDHYDSLTGKKASISSFKYERLRHNANMINNGMGKNTIDVQYANQKWTDLDEKNDISFPFLMISKEILPHLNKGNLSGYLISQIKRGGEKLVQDRYNEIPSDIEKAKWRKEQSAHYEVNKKGAVTFRESSFASVKQHFTTVITEYLEALEEWRKDMQQDKETKLLLPIKTESEVSRL